MTITRPKEERLLREASDISKNILKKLGDSIAVGTTSLEIDELAGYLCKKYGVQPAFKRVSGYNFNTCISVNDVAVHGVPTDTPLRNGDLVSIDFGIIHRGFYTDHCWTWSVGEPSKKDEKLLQAGRDAVENALSEAVVGNYTGDLGYVMEKTAKDSGFNVMRMFVGHGIGKSLHGRPDIPAYGKRGTGELLVDGMVICIECQVVDDTGDVVIADDGWSAKTENGGNSVMFEYMVIVREDFPDILTDTRDWNTVVI